MVVQILHDSYLGATAALDLGVARSSVLYTDVKTSETSKLLVAAFKHS